MIIIINKRFADRELFFGTVLKSQLVVDLDKKHIEYSRDYIPFNIDVPTIEKKVEYKISGLLNVSVSKYEYLTELINKIKNNNIGSNISSDKNNILDYLKYIDLNIDGQDYAIDVNTIEYEMLVHLSTFEFYDNSEIEFLEKKVLPID